MSPFEQHPFRQAASLHRGLRRRGDVPAQDAAIHTAGDVVIAKGAGRVEAIIDLPGEGTIGRDLVVRSAATGTRATPISRR